MIFADLPDRGTPRFIAHLHYPVIHDRAATFLGPDNTRKFEVCKKNIVAGFEGLNSLLLQEERVPSPRCRGGLFHDLVGPFQLRIPGEVLCASRQGELRRRWNKGGGPSWSFRGGSYIPEEGNSDHYNDKQPGTSRHSGFLSFSRNLPHVRGEDQMHRKDRGFFFLPSNLKVLHIEKERSVFEVLQIPA